MIDNAMLLPDRHNMMKAFPFTLRLAATVLAILGAGLGAGGQDLTAPQVTSELVFAEQDGLVAVEAEHFFAQELTDRRAFYRVTTSAEPDVTPDGDPSHAQQASGGAYLEILPDTRRTHGDRLIVGENFSPQPGKMAILKYKVHFNNPGRYYVWARIFSTGTEDNGLHVGIDGEWPASGQRMQWTAKRQWFWDSKQRTHKVHTGVPGQLFLDVESAGEHVIMFSMREDGFEFDKWLMTTDRAFARPKGAGPEPRVMRGALPKALAASEQQIAVAAGGGSLLRMPRQPDGDATVEIGGEQKQWHNVTLTLDGPFAYERDQAPNPFLDYRMTVRFRHESGLPDYRVPGYFAADGDAGQTSAEAGVKWRAHLAPDKPGQWSYQIEFVTGKQAAINPESSHAAVAAFDGLEGSFSIAPTDKRGRDLRGKGRLQYVGERYLRFAGSGEYFLKAGADAPETLLAYVDFDGTTARKPKAAPLKSWKPHVGDWRPGDPLWRGDRGKGLIGAVNYLASKGCNAFSFLTYNAGGDGDNVWPFVERDEKLHYDCSKLDQWGIVFNHATSRGMYLHFKLQETENDDNRAGHKATAAHIPTALDGGSVGVERKLYLREIVARFGHNLALNWNLGEENTQSTAEQNAMLDYLAATDPYGHLRVLHTYPHQQDKVYRPLIGDQSKLTGLSLQNSHIRDTHRQVVKWIDAAAATGKQWVVAFDESGSAAHAQCPDLGYRGFDGHDSEGKYAHTQHEVRQQTLWGALMAGGAGVEYYFGYRFVENDLICEDWRSRDQSWDYCRIALQFFRDKQIPFWEMISADALVGNPQNNNSKYCLAKPGEQYVVYLPKGGSTDLDLRDQPGEFEVRWFNPRVGGSLVTGSTQRVTGGQQVSLGNPPSDPEEDWVVVVRR